jgi:glycosyltransferase A (GT-A) superfamily protein (DUF2064 family)
MRNSKTAILLFSLNASQEAMRKKLDPSIGYKNNERLAHHLIDHTFNQAKQSGFPVLTFSQQDQLGQNFGDKLAYAVETSFKKGFDKLIVIGNDCPDVNTQLLLKAEQELNQKDIVLGPAQDGGVYLIGLHKKLFNKRTFSELPWQKVSLSTLWQQQLLNDGLSISWLQSLADIDDLDDLKKYYTQNTHQPLASILSLIVEGIGFLRFPAHLAAYLCRVIRGSMSLRAPPLVPIAL